MANVRTYRINPISLSSAACTSRVVRCHLLALYQVLCVLPLDQSYLRQYDLRACLALLQCFCWMTGDMHTRFCEDTAPSKCHRLHSSPPEQLLYLDQSIDLLALFGFLSLHSARLVRIA
ncbi:hypothetical protein PENSPDRAFT_52113 [Peniophora sp. CONT]|nr:hypothetical protein PENSPDRAFT_52113 [Peniophora sp. CONT]